MSYGSAKFRTRVAAIDRHASDIKVIELHPADSGGLPPFSAGSHIDVVLPGELVRSYSLAGPPGETGRYVIGVKRDDQGRGGSRIVHGALKVGDEVIVSAPRNTFLLEEEAEHTLLIAGGIGITPLMSMIHRLEELERQWRLHYAARDAGDAAFLESLQSFGPKVSLHFTRAPEGASRLDIAAIIASAPPSAHFYCCGPSRMLQDFEQATTHLAPAQVHLERFSSETPVDTDGAFRVKLAKSGVTVEIPSGKTILDVLLERGEDVAFSCTEGICGTCETKVLAGTPDHRDMVLTAAQHAANDRIMICCSRLKSGVLVLDL